MSLIAGLLVLGFALIALEIVIPGGIVGAFGGLSLLAGVVVAYQEFGASGALVAGGVGIVGVALSLYIEFKILPKTSLGRRFFLRQSVTAKSQPDVADDSLVGKRGQALTALSPTGYVLVEGRRIEAYSRSGFLPKGEKVEVVSFDAFKVTVSKI